MFVIFLKLVHCLNKQKVHALCLTENYPIFVCTNEEVYLWWFINAFIFSKSLGGGENVRNLLPILWHLIFFWFRNLQFPLIRILDTCAFIKILPLRVYNYVLYWYTSNLILWYSTVTLFAYNLKLTGASIWQKIASYAIIATFTFTCKSLLLSWVYVDATEIWQKV